MKVAVHDPGGLRKELTQLTIPIRSVGLYPPGAPVVLIQVNDGKG
jgi:hypothetical protein